jgi:hypothetical protein
MRPPLDGSPSPTGYSMGGSPDERAVNSSGRCRGRHRCADARRRHQPQHRRRVRAGDAGGGNVSRHHRLLRRSCLPRLRRLPSSRGSSASQARGDHRRVSDGSARDAVLAAAGANATHGIRRTNADKRHAIERLLADPEWSRWSDHEIARACHVDHKTVGRVRREVTGEFPSERSVTYRDRHGNLSQMRMTGEIPSERPSLTSRLLAKVSTEDLIAELQRRGLEVRDA